MELYEVVELHRPYSGRNLVKALRSVCGVGKCDAHGRWRLVQSSLGTDWVDSALDSVGRASHPTWQYAHMHRLVQLLRAWTELSLLAGSLAHASVKLFWSSSFARGPQLGKTHTSILLLCILAFYFLPVHFEGCAAILVCHWKYLKPFWFILYEF